LTLAAAELVAGKAKVIDIALKYGYESPNAFTRAFRNMHGLNPRETRASGVKLLTCHRVSFHVEIKGVSGMNYGIIEKPAFKLAGKSKKFTHENFFKEAPKYWKEYVHTKQYLALWGLTNGKWGPVTEAPLMSVYLPGGKGNRDAFTDIFGMEISTEIHPKKFQVFEIPAATYAEFNCTYQTAAKMNKTIYGEWLPSTGYERDAQKPDIAAYFPVAFMPIKDMGVRWWIPVVKKK
jgi:AraC family transcriptional regulator